MTAAHKRLSADPQSAILPGYSFGYAFDDIGNRETATANSKTASYTANLTNQYASREIPGFVDVLGDAHTGAAVSVDAQAAQRTGREFYRHVAVDNTNDPVHAAIEKKTEIDSQLVDETRWAFAAEDPEIFVHDDDGNLESDGRWTYEWDAENRLKVIETRAGVAALFPAIKQRLEFAYDFQGRRISKKVYASLTAE